jgi:hypothetical protein
MASNRHPVDELGEVRAKIKVLQAREAELRAAVLDDNCDRVGDEYVAVVRAQSQARVDIPALKKHMGAKLNPFMVEREVTQIWVVARRVGGGAA